MKFEDVYKQVEKGWSKRCYKDYYLTLGVCRLEAGRDDGFVRIDKKPLPIYWKDHPRLYRYFKMRFQDSKNS